MTASDSPYRGEPGSLWRRNAEELLTEIIDHDDENGALANACGDDLRDALRLAAQRLREEARP